ncbi:MAG: DUF5666 domain-containing protein [Candidatus Sulfotelmatobacter sp.]
MNRNTGSIKFALRVLAVLAFVAVFPSADCIWLCYAISAQQAQQPATSSASSRHLGAIKAINGTSITLAPDSGPDVIITVQPTTRLLRIAPGQKDLKSATPIQLWDMQVGDRILVGGKPSDNASVLAITVIVMTHSDLAALHQQELQDWQRRGVDGPVTAVDAAAGTVTITSSRKPVVIHCLPSTVIRRYAPDSVKFDDAKPSTIAAIHPGDQLRARGQRSADGGELTAEEIVSGAFRNIAGTVNSVDGAASTVNVHDLLSKQAVTVKITPDSQLHQLPLEMAQRIAMRLQRSGAGASTAQGTASGGESHRPEQNENANAGQEGGPRRFGGAADLQQILNRTPTVSLNDLHKGEAIIVLSTEGAANQGTAITLLTGVDPILEAAPNASGASILTPWSLGAPSGEPGGP